MLDLWAERWRRHEATGAMIIVRGACPRAGRRPDPWADDVVAGFEREDDAHRFLAAMRARFEEFALSLHPDKTRLIAFGRLAASDRKKRGLGRPETFDFLGFHPWPRDRFNVKHPRCEPYAGKPQVRFCAGGAQ